MGCEHDTHYDALLNKVCDFGKCGCTVEGAGTLKDPVRIVYCDSHKERRVKERAQHTAMMLAFNSLRKLVRRYGPSSGYTGAQSTELREAEDLLEHMDQSRAVNFHVVASRILEQMPEEDEHGALHLDGEAMVCVEDGEYLPEMEPRKYCPACLTAVIAAALADALHEEV